MATRHKFRRGKGPKMYRFELSGQAAVFKAQAMYDQPDLVPFNPRIVRLGTDSIHDHSPPWDMDRPFIIEGWHPGSRGGLRYLGAE